MSLFPVNSQQWFNTESIETIDDYGHDIMVRLKSGREMRLHGGNREAFFDAIKGQMVGKKDMDDDEMLRLLSKASRSVDLQPVPESRNRPVARIGDEAADGQASQRDKP